MNLTAERHVIALRRWTGISISSCLIPESNPASAVLIKGLGQSVSGNYHGRLSLRAGEGGFIITPALAFKFNLRLGYQLVVRKTNLYCLCIYLYNCVLPANMCFCMCL